MNKIFLLSLACCFLSLPAYTQDPGQLDVNWAENGSCIIGFENSDLYSYCAAIQSDGNIIVAGCRKEVSSSDKNLFAVKIDESGQLADFGNADDHFVLDLSEENEYIQAIYIDQNDNIFLGGNSGLNGFLIKLDPHGEIDTSFGENGMLRFERVFKIRGISPYIIESNHALLLAGNDLDYAGLVLINENGSINENFGDNGWCYVPVMNSWFNQVGVAIDNGYIYASGHVFLSGGYGLLSRFFLDGQLDNSFSDDGSLLIEAPNSGTDLNFLGQALHSEDADKITLSGAYLHPEGDYDVCACQINDNGEMNVLFGMEGWSFLRWSFSDETLSSFKLQENGQMYFGGDTDKNGTKDLLMGKISEDGFPDLEFGQNGFVITDLSDGSESASELLIHPSGERLYLAGETINPDLEKSLIVTRYYSGYSSSIDQLAGDRTEIWPNPVSDLLYIENEYLHSNHFTIKVYSSDGALLFHKKIKNCHQGIKIKRSGLKPGMHLLTIQTDEWMKTKKIIIQ